MALLKAPRVFDQPRPLVVGKGPAGSRRGLAHRFTRRRDLGGLTVLVWIGLRHGLGELNRRARSEEKTIAQRRWLVVQVGRRCFPSPFPFAVFLTNQDREIESLLCPPKSAGVGYRTRSGCPLYRVFDVPGVRCIGCSIFGQRPTEQWAHGPSDHGRIHHGRVRRHPERGEAAL